MIQKRYAQYRDSWSLGANTHKYLPPLSRPPRLGAGAARGAVKSREGTPVQNVGWVAVQGVGLIDARVFRAQEPWRPSSGRTGLRSPRKPFRGEPPELPLPRGVHESRPKQVLDPALRPPSQLSRELRSTALLGLTCRLRLQGRRCQLTWPQYEKHMADPN